MPANDLSQAPVHLGRGATAIAQPPFTGAEWYAAYGQRHADDGDEGRLIAMHTFARSWDSWEMHPRGSEVVICTQGELTLVQEIDGEHRRTTLQPGQYAINPPGVWHTADVSAPVTAIFVTAGAGTEHRAR
ncbi:MAG: cupin domain-containing protein [Myxococcales bacterium FL481]|nr:MAG: cupin domain-containing protein [Myxococcales bacterium FL481]